MALKDWTKVHMNGTRYRKGIYVLNISQNIASKKWETTVRSTRSNYYFYDKKFRTITNAKKAAKTYMQKN